MDLIETIQKYGLSIRQIPTKVISLHEIRHHKEGNEIVEVELEKHWNYEVFKSKQGDNPNFIFDDKTKTIKRKFTKVVKIPKNAGFWMCKQVKNNSSTVSWSSKSDNLAPTLKGSINLFLKTI